MYISIDVGGTNTRVAGARGLEAPNFVDEPIKRRNMHEFDTDLEFMIDSALKIAQKETIQAIGIGTPGSPNDERTEIVSVKNLSSWIGKPLVSSLSESLGCPVYYENDVVAAAFGEVFYGSNENNFDYIVWGTGVGGARAGSNSSRTEVTVESISWSEQFREWEMSMGGSELSKIYGKQPEEFDDKDWERVKNEFKHNLRAYIATKRPQAIVFGGGLAVRHKDWISEIDKESEISIATTSFEEVGGLVGGLGLIRRSITPG